MTKSKAGGGGGVDVLTWSQGGGGGEVVDHWCCPPPLPKYYRMTDACKNITFARFVTRAVIKKLNWPGLCYSDCVWLFIFAILSTKHKKGVEPIPYIFLGVIKQNKNTFPV